MIRGILGGVLWGGLLVVAALAVLSQIGAPPTGQALVPLAADRPVAVAVAELEAAAQVADPVAVVAPPQETATIEATPEGTDNAATEAASGQATPPGADSAVADAGQDNLPEDAASGAGAPLPSPEADRVGGAATPRAQEGGGDVVAEGTGAAVSLAEQDSNAAATGARQDEGAAPPEAAPGITHAAPAEATAPAVPEAPAATVAEADPAPLPATATGDAGAPLADTGVTPPQDPAPAALPEAASVAEEPAEQTGTPPARSAVPPQLATDAPPPPAAPPAAPENARIAAPDQVADLGPVNVAPPTVFPPPARPEAVRPDPAPGPADALPAPVLAEAPAAPVEPPPSDDAAPLVPAEAPLPDPAPVPAAPAVAAADAPPPAADRPEAAPEVVAASEGAVLRRPARLIPDAGLGSDADAPRATGLPRIIGPAAEPAPEAAATDPVLIEAEDGLADDRPAIERFARDFENAAGKPVFSIMLIDDGDPALDRRALAAMPFPVTFVLDPSRPESALASSIYREGGQEVAMMATGLPEGATASDLEVTFAAYGDVLPEAVAIVDPETGGFQGDRAVATMVAPIAAGQGRGLLSWDRGLNAAEQVARREGLRSGVIYRRLDGEGEDAGTMRRSLDRAAFKAAQDGRVIVAGGTSPETVAALLEWALEGRATTVALAPLSAALVAE